MALRTAVFCSVLMTLFLHSGDAAIKCYGCSGSPCADPFTGSADMERDCDPAITACAKLTINILGVTRACSDSTIKQIKDQAGDAVEHFSECDSNLCNAADGLSSASVLLYSLLAVALLARH